MQEKQAVFSELESAVKNFDREAAVEAAKKALKIGVDPVEAIEKAKEVEADVIGASALMTVTTSAQKELADAISKSCLKAEVVYIVGGAAVTPQWAEEIGAVYAPDANSAVKVIKSSLEARK